jgi:hypothetical protein
MIRSGAPYGDDIQALLTHIRDLLGSLFIWNFPEGISDTII